MENNEVQHDTLTDPDIREKFLALIALGIGIENDGFSLSDEESRKISRVAKQQAVLPIIQRGVGVGKIASSKEALRDMRRACARDTFHTIHNQEAVKSLRKVLDQEQIPYILLKGATLSSLYPESYLRTSSDIDILIREEDVGKALPAIEKGTDFQVKEKGYRDISMVSPYVHLELHFTIIENIEKMDAILSKAWDYAAPSGEGSRYVFTPEFLVFHIVAHMCNHCKKTGLGIRPFIDLWLLRNKTSYDESEVRALCEKSGILTFYEECCHLTDVWFAKAPHTETSQMLEEFCLSGGVYGSSRIRYVVKQRKQSGPRYILRRLFPPAYEVKTLYQDESGKKHTTAYYYLKRDLSWLRKNRRDELKSRINNIMSADKDHIDSVSELFKRLDL
ncbi:MAG: nucleotidyltransferase family protein [Clostridiales bacterium]|nr:nucleotidyltransferase family protein [Clostridiales bacterium]